MSPVTVAVCDVAINYTRTDARLQTVDIATDDVPARQIWMREVDSSVYDRDRLARTCKRNSSGLDFLSLNSMHDINDILQQGVEPRHVGS